MFYKLKVNLKIMKKSFATDDKFYRFLEEQEIGKSPIQEMGLDLAFVEWLRFGHTG